MHNHAFDIVQNTKAQKQIKNAPDKLSGIFHRKNKTKIEPLKNELAFGIFFVLSLAGFANIYFACTNVVLNFTQLQTCVF